MLFPCSHARKDLNLRKDTMLFHGVESPHRSLEDTSLGIFIKKKVALQNLNLIFIKLLIPFLLLEELKT